MRLASLAAFAVLAVACDKTVPTPKGTKLVDIPKFTKLSITSWTVGAPRGPTSKVDKTYRFSSGAGPDVRFKIAFEHGPSELVESKPKPDAPPPVQTPRALEIEVVENTGWAMSGKCEDDLKVPLEVSSDGTAAYPKNVWASCTIIMKRKNGNIELAPSVEVNGDGRLVVKAVGSDEHVVEE